MAEVKAVLAAPHSNKPFHDWVFLPGWRGVPVTVKRDSLGRQHKFAWRDWAVLICNNTECSARAFVSVDVLTDAAELALPVPRDGDEVTP